ncbi:glycosyltransferase family 2 protein [Natronomonas halophila]|uniref:glycosyltransferase family 2 protein n=1 Tax=Natronomonas halophila TaxID=2747817 RepID=UPI0015B39E62|nr:glycosyltransferase family 2 protein [Natronomonas halophila]QLD87083.1 glycosyltransferase family 2 protein [Natronomonas halophila]
MSQSYDTQDGEVRAAETSDEKPAVGIIATGDNDDEIARVCLRAHSRDHDVFIAYEDSIEPTLPEAADLDNTTMVPMATDEAASSGQEAAKSRLEVAARTNSANGLLLVDDPSTRIDFDESLEAFDTETYVSAAVPEPSVGLRTLIAVPAYNEAATIGSVVEEALAHADDVLVIDDGSTDQTAELAESAGATVVSHERNQGYGAALQTAFETADTWNVECLVIVDGDDQHDLEDIPKLRSKITDGDANVVIGSRFAEGEHGAIPLYRRFGLSIVNTLSNISMGALNPRSWVSDTQSGFRAYDEHVIEELADAQIGDDMDASLNILYQIHGNGYDIEEVSTVVDYEVEDGHSQNPIRHGIQLVSTILQTIEQDHPVLFLGVPGTVLTLLGLFGGYLTFANYMATQTFPIGHGLGSALLILLGVFSGFTAIVLHSLQAHYGP